MDRNSAILCIVEQEFGRSLRGNVDRNPDLPGMVVSVVRRSLRGNVDRNDISPCLMPIVGVVPYVGTWIEMSKEWIEEDKSIVSFPTWERG